MFVSNILGDFCEFALNILDTVLEFLKTNGKLASVIVIIVLLLFTFFPPFCSIFLD